jgi:hypothetical protein
VVSVEPANLATGVGTTTPLTITFSEGVGEDRINDAIWVRPHNVIRDVSMDGAIATIRFRNPFPDSATVGVVLTTVVRDGRGNAMIQPHHWIFSTGDSTASGRIHGTLDHVGTGPSRGQALVALYPTAGDTLPDPNVEDPFAVTQAGTDGAFDVPGLEPDGRVYLLFALLDRNEDRIVSGPGEFYSAAPESVRVTPEASTREVDLELIDPQAPGIVQGKLQRAAGDSSAVVVELMDATGDSLAAPVAVGAVRPDGGFSLPRIPPGVYRLLAACDTNANGRRDREEAWLVLRSEVQVPAGRTLETGELPGPQCPPGGPERKQP